ncbi:hypothetical protein QR680_016785 [Steinernema hermaphroditum]|uniref:ABC transporter domain-containing protein n=1 Tax=Steinernema hermaphroditum TaxID=289476 RepID=A0AA39HE99_9BILA|nr:hypothetical protein QR680_016785 [Steinernema hermaphroditum]
MSILAQFRLLIWKNLLTQLRSPWFTALEFFLPLVLIGISFGFMIGYRRVQQSKTIYIVKNVVMEKEDRLKEYMRVMGLSQWIHWVAHFVVSYIKLLFAVVVLSVLLKIVMSKSDPSVHFVFFALYALYAFNAVCFAFAVSTFFQSGTAGTMMAVIGWMILWFWMIIFNGMDSSQPFSFSARMAHCLNPNIVMFFALNRMSELEIRSDRVSWSKVWKLPSIDDSLTLGHLFVMQMVSEVIFVLVTWKLFDCKYNITGEKKAVDHVSLNIFRSQITALLGHNGAGMSATFSMLTGVTAPSSGTAFINNFDIRSSLPQIGKSLGLCPQYNILFKSLTVMEHLEFFCKLKGRRFCKEEAKEMLAKLKLDFKERAFTGSLSGGQKRKLSLAIALIGGSEVVMLDELTSGMDPGARHDTWTLLQEEKKNRSILLSTHFVEDVLGDRIAILTNGQLQCCGSGMFLKKSYGGGYHLKHNPLAFSPMWAPGRRPHGYCPQYDAIIKEMSGEKTLFIFARLRRMPEAEIPRIVDTVIRAIGIGIYARRQIKTYIRGNKRRLSLGIALVGMPDVLLLDEPTTGVDPRARRIIWNVLSMVRRHGAAIVLTSHSMEECEALCTSLVIMVYGHFRCFGSVQHFKNPYGTSYNLLVRLKDKKHSQVLKEAIKEHFPGSVLKEEHLLQLNFELKRREETSWSVLFTKMERLLDPAGIEDYSLSQTTLEQVFLEFTREAVVE